MTPDTIRQLSDTAVIDIVKYAKNHTADEIQAAKDIIAEKELLSNEEVDAFLTGQRIESGEAGGEAIDIDENKLQRYLEGLKMEENFSAAIGAGLTGAVVSAVLWAVITVATEYQIGYMALAVGFIVGMAVRVMGKGISLKFGIWGAACSIFGCVLGNLLSVVGFEANALGMGYFELMGKIDWTLIPTIIIDTFDPMDLLFYGFALYMGYKFSFREITEEEIIANATQQ